MGGFARVGTGIISGVEALPVTVECYRGPGLPQTSLVGLARGAVREALVRVRSAIGSSGFSLGSRRIIANLLPAEIPKEASSIDLALAIAMLAATDNLDARSGQGARFFGELSLSGRVESSRGVVLVSDLVRKTGECEIFVPRANAAEAALIPGVRVHPVDHLKQLIEHLRGEQALEVATGRQSESVALATTDLSEVAGQARAKRALSIAAAGGHNVLLIGPPGSGKTMLAERLVTLLPPLDAEEATELTRIYSAAGMLNERPSMYQAPFRSPHHTASYSALCGGGAPLMPGEVTLAHRGVLFLDELPEFSRRSIEALREPLENGAIHVARARERARFPARTLVIAAMNPCPCGHYQADFSSRALPSALSALKGDGQDSDREHRYRNVCVCDYRAIQRYRSRVSGPVLDRIDLHVAVEPVNFRDMWQDPEDRSDPLSSSRLKHRVQVARERQCRRLGPGRYNAFMTGDELQRYASSNDAAAINALERAMDIECLSSRGLSRVRKVARSIADLDGADQLTVAHVEEALSFRILERTSSTPTW